MDHAIYRDYIANWRFFIYCSLACVLTQIASIKKGAGFIAYSIRDGGTVVIISLSS